ncbi:uncharacterized protein HKW66_Vig0252780 [Vigna angularis]|uniref:WDR11 first beta-propeller domain-containing protein n=1 Tax=Phaseolus angularis TaxID=3914 RepID=A0A8T0K100_PHAAN|nr:uncharacterized protein HKW66_Vig0252780 [Vigna angularis]
MQGSPRVPPTVTAQPQDSWESMLSCPPNRNNFGSADLSLNGLTAFPSGSSISIVDTRSMQLLTSFPHPSPAFIRCSLRHRPPLVTPPSQSSPSLL